MECDNCSNTSLLRHTFPEYMVTSSVLSLCCVLGIPGNIAVLRILAQRLKEKSFTPRLMISLAVADLLTMFHLPLWIWTLQHGWSFGTLGCKLLSYVTYWFLYSSLLCVLSLSVQRYIQVLHTENWAKFGTAGQKLLLCGIWILSGLIALYAPIEYNDEYDVNGLMYCQQHYQNDSELVLTSIAEILILVLFLFLLVFFYFKLHQGVNCSAFFRSNRLTKLVIRIVVVCFICWIPLVILKIILIVALSLKLGSTVQTVHHTVSIAEAITFFNNCVNPFLYAFTFREQQKRTEAVVNI